MKYTYSCSKFSVPAGILSCAFVLTAGTASFFNTYPLGFQKLHARVLHKLNLSV